MVIIFIKLIPVLLLVYIVTTHLLAWNWHRFCKKDKECRNMVCSKGKSCPFNSIWHED